MHPSVSELDAYSSLLYPQPMHGHTASNKRSLESLTQNHQPWWQSVKLAHQLRSSSVLKKEESSLVLAANSPAKSDNPPNYPLNYPRIAWYNSQV